MVKGVQEGSIDENVTKILLQKALSGEAQVTIIRYVTETTVARVEERHRKQHVSGVGDKAVMDDVSDGWWIVTVAPQPYAFRAGDEKPTCQPGDHVTFTMEVFTMEV